MYTLCYNNIKGKSFLVCDGSKWSWFRSGRVKNYCEAYVMGASGVYGYDYISDTYGVRPALHSAYNKNR